MISDLAEQYENKKIKQSVAVNLSYLTDIEQDYVNTFIITQNVSITEEQSKELKNMSQIAAEKGEEITVDDIEKILTLKEEKKDKTKKVKYAIPEEYFPNSIKKQKREEYILKALEYIQNHGISLEE